MRAEGAACVCRGKRTSQHELVSRRAWGAGAAGDGLESVLGTLWGFFHCFSGFFCYIFYRSSLAFKKFYFDII